MEKHQSFLIENGESNSLQTKMEKRTKAIVYIQKCGRRWSELTKEAKQLEEVNKFSVKLTFYLKNSDRYVQYKTKEAQLELIQPHN